MGWPFDELDLKAGSLYEVRANCMFATKYSYESVNLIQVEKGTILMSLGWEPDVENENTDFQFKFLYDEKVIILPIVFTDEITEDMTEKEKIGLIRVFLSSYVKTASHGYRPPSVPVEPHLIGDSRYGDDDDWDEFH